MTMIPATTLCSSFRPHLLHAGLALLLALAWSTVHAVTEPFTEARFKALQAAEALILVDIHADWCPTCKKQGEALDAYEAAHPDVPLHRLVVDFDTQKEWVKHFKAPRQSTLILYRGTAQRWFSVAETRPAALAEAIDAAAAP
ncbi:MAG: thioredoxin domain-containing protein [Gammaproteobacteria bacterium]